MATGTIPIIHTNGMEKWYLTDGLSESNVIAAYQFIGDNASVININEGTKYELALANVALIPNTGLFFPPSQGNHCANNNSLANIQDSMKAGIFSYAVPITYWSTGGGIMFTNRRLAVNMRDSSTLKRGIMVRNLSGTTYTYNTTYMFNKGIVGCNWASTSQVYFNGRAISSATSFGSPYTSRNDLLANEAGDIGDQSGFWCSAVVVYNKELTGEQHKVIAKQIMDLGGFF